MLQSTNKEKCLTGGKAVINLETDTESTKSKALTKKYGENRAAA